MHLRQIGLVWGAVFALLLAPFSSAAASTYSPLITGDIRDVNTLVVGSFLGVNGELLDQQTQGGDLDRVVKAVQAALSPKYLVISQRAFDMADAEQRPVALLLFTTSANTEDVDGKKVTTVSIAVKLKRVKSHGQEEEVPTVNSPSYSFVQPDSREQLMDKVATGARFLTLYLFCGSDFKHEIAGCNAPDQTAQHHSTSGTHGALPNGGAIDFR